MFAPGGPNRHWPASRIPEPCTCNFFLPEPLHPYIPGLSHPETPRTFGCEGVAGEAIQAVGPLRLVTQQRKVVVAGQLAHPGPALLYNKQHNSEHSKQAAEGLHEQQSS